jgi:hypothetical protein
MIDKTTVLIAKWRHEADDFEADGDDCCAQTRRHDADELAELVRDRRDDFGVAVRRLEAIGRLGLTVSVGCGPSYTTVDGTTAFGTIPSLCFEIAERELRGVGDATLGEWREIGDTAVHLRRRLTPREERQGRIGGVCDVRGTEEFTHRIRAMRPFLPPQMRHFPDEALP